MGARHAIDRIIAILDRRGVRVRVQLDVHDPEGFGCEDNVPPAGSIKPTTMPKMIRRRREIDLASPDRAPQSNSLPSVGSPHRSGPGRWTDGYAESHVDGDIAISIADPAITAVTDGSSAATSAATMAPPQQIEPLPLAAIRPQPLADVTTIYDPPAIADASRLAAIVKRSVDILGSSVGLVMLSPIMAAAAVAVRMGDGQPALFRQTREGRRGRAFTIYKLRTMSIDAESRQADLRELSHRDGPAFKIADDPRITPVGNFLRKTCIDELPQLINVLRGDMSLVGPRPLPWHESRACQQWQRRRLEIRPGMTCYWQIDKASVQTFDQWMRLDLLYLERSGFFEDIRLIARTVTVPLHGRGGE